MPNRPLKDRTKTLLITTYEVDEKTLADLVVWDCIAMRLKKPGSLDR
jgi:hypothetical protein